MDMAEVEAEEEVEKAIDLIKTIIYSQLSSSSSEEGIMIIY
jgi:hypothetical protein